jgi:hypothetical protein
MIYSQQTYTLAAMVNQYHKLIEWEKWWSLHGSKLNKWTEKSGGQRHNEMLVVAAKPQNCTLGMLGSNL